MRAIVVANDRAGGSTVEVLQQLEPVLRSLSDELDTIWTSERPEAVEKVAAAVASGSVDLVVAAGGDGTVCGVAEGVARGLGRWPESPSPIERGRPAGGGDVSDRRGPPARGWRHDASDEPGVAMLIVPAGTGNSVYRATWGDRPFEEVAAAIGDPSCSVVRQLDMAVVEETGSAFLLGACAGLVAQIVEIAAGLAGVSGRDRYALAGLSALGEPAVFTGSVWLDGALALEGPISLVAVGGARHRGGTFQLLPQSVLDDGLMDLCVLGECGPERLAELAGMVVAGEHVGQPEIVYRQGHEVVIERSDGAPLLFELDGDLWTGAEERLTLSMVPGALPVHCPAKAVAG